MAKGRAVLTLTVEPIPPDCCVAVEVLCTSRLRTNSAAMVSKLKARLWFSDAICRPLTSTVLNSGPKPRTVISWPSPPERSIDTPVMRCSDSARLVSGNLPMSSAEMESTTPPASRLESIARPSAPRMPRTSMTSVFVSSLSCTAKAGDTATVLTTAITAVATLFFL